MKAKLKVMRVLSLFFAMSIILSSCSSGGSDPVAVNQDASGLYTGSGTGKFNAGAQKTMTKVKGMGARWQVYLF